MSNGFSFGYIKEEFLRYCKWEYANGHLVYTPIESGEYRFIAFDFGVSIRLVFNELKSISLDYNTYDNKDNDITLVFNYADADLPKSTSITIDNNRLLDFSFVRTGDSFKVKFPEDDKNEEEEKTERIERVHQ